MEWKHDDLAHDLANTLRAGDRLVWEDMQLGPSGSPRPDVYTVPKSYANFRPLAYEIKVSVADFRRDVTAGKWQSYLAFAAGVVFAVPAGLIDKREVPPGCGLMVRGEAGWRTLKGPTLGRVNNLPLEAWLKLLIDGTRRLDTPLQPRDAARWAYSGRARKVLGERVAGLMRNMGGAEAALEYELTKLRERQAGAIEERQRLADEIRERAKADALEVDLARSELAMVLGLPPEAALWTIRQAARQAAAALGRDAEVVRLRGLLADVRRALEAAERETPALGAMDGEEEVCHAG